MLHAGDDEAEGDDDPEEVAEEVVGPEVKGLGAAVLDALDDDGVGGGGVVEDVAVELAEADDELQGVAQGGAGDDAPGADEGEGAPEDGGDGLHGDDEGVAGEVARVGEGVLLPQLAEDVHLIGHGGVVVRKVTF